MTLYPCLHPQSRPSHLFSETGTPYLVASCGVEPLSCGSKPPALPLSYLAVHPRLSGVSAPWPLEQFASWSPQNSAATSQDSKRPIVICPRGAMFAAWKVRPSGPDRGLHRAAAYKMEPFLPGVPCGILHPAPISERSIFLEGSPPAGTHKRGNLLSVLYLTRYPRRGNGLAFGPWLVTARKGRKKGRSTGKLLPHAPFSHRFLEKFPLEVEFQKFFICTSFSP